jgi:hypothetical protein
LLIGLRTLVRYANQQSTFALKYYKALFVQNAVGDIG